jgi:beta-glucosidase
METIKTPKQAETANHVSQLLAQMTLEEKVGQMVQIDFSVLGFPDDPQKSHALDSVRLENALNHYHIGSVLNAPVTPQNQAQSVAAWHAITQAIQQAAAKTRLKIPVLYGIDAIHGATYTQNATLFPQAISMAATFNPKLSQQEGEITAREIRVSGLPWNFSPVMDIGRQPLWPRLWETYGEDVHLASTLGAAFIKGHQGDDFSAPGKAATCLKHFVGYSFPINGKDRTPAWISERMLREYFLPSFEAGIKAGSPTIMINSSEVDGIPGHANHHYLTTILRDEMGFKGFTISDWEDIIRLYTRDKMAASPREAVKIAVMAGVDMSMVPLDFSFYDLLLDLAKAGEVPMTRIDEAVSRILTVKYQTGLFKPDHLPLPAENNFATPAAQAINLQAAHEAIILAKNDRAVLPLQKSAKVLVTGPTANLLSALNGGWTITWQGDNESLYPKDKLTVLAALQQKSPGNITYVPGSCFDSEIDIANAVSAAKNQDVILLCLGEKPYTETMGNIDNLDLPAAQTKLAQALLATGKPVVLLMLGGRPRIITPIAEQAAGVVLGFLPGMEGGRAIADVLLGEYNPNGKLPITYPRHPNGITLYDYKPIESLDSNSYKPLYPFGHGLSYTSFDTSGLAVAKPQIKMGESVDISVNVKNTGKLAGQETILLYLQDLAASVTRPNKQLKAFKKVLLAAGESQQLHFTITPHDLSFIGVDLKRVVEAGEFEVKVEDETVKFVVVE